MDLSPPYQTQMGKGILHTTLLNQSQGIKWMHKQCSIVASMGAAPYCAYVTFAPSCMDNNIGSASIPAHRWLPY